MIVIREHMLEVNFEVELDRYEWKQKCIRGGKLLACSPFRDERHPSFAVRLDNGVWIDSGSSSEEWKKGGFVRLLSFLRQEQEEETEDYLVTTYGISPDVDSLTLTSTYTTETQSARIVLPKESLTPLKFRHPYLGARGIDEDTQRLFRIGYDKKSRSVSMPWFSKSGELINVKFRSVTDKRFWYFPAGDRIRNHIYGLHVVSARRLSSVYVTESETDALYLWANGFPAVALGGANLSERQKDLFLSSTIRELIVATDKDDTGERIAQTLFAKLSGFMDVRRVMIPDGAKDVNELSPEILAQVASNVVDFRFTIESLSYK